MTCSPPAPSGAPATATAPPLDATASACGTPGTGPTSVQVDPPSWDTHRRSHVGLAGPHTPWSQAATSSVGLDAARTAGPLVPRHGGVHGCHAPLTSLSP